MFKLVIRRKSKLIKLLVVLLACYITAYLHFRRDGELIRYERTSQGDRNQIMARSDAWDDLAYEMQMTSDSILLKSLAQLARIKRPLLNGTFWPLRKLESVYWNCTNR